MGIAPSTKWTSKHHFKDPVLELVDQDDFTQVVGVVVYGSSDNNNQKIKMSNRAASTVLAMNPDGVILEVDGFGNNHIDWVNCFDQIGKKKIPVVGITFKGKNDFVVKSKYLANNYVDVDHAHQMVETLVVGQNVVQHQDAKQALDKLKIAMIKNKK